MLEALFGSKVVERVLLYLFVYKEGYPSAIAKTFNLHFNAVYRQLKRMERGGILVSRFRGKTRMYSFNPLSPFRKQLLALIARVYECLSEKEKEKFFRQRTRPVRQTKLW